MTSVARRTCGTGEHVDVVIHCRRTCLAQGRPGTCTRAKVVSRNERPEDHRHDPHLAGGSPGVGFDLSLGCGTCAGVRRGELASVDAGDQACCRDAGGRRRVASDTWPGGCGPTGSRGPDPAAQPARWQEIVRVGPPNDRWTCAARSPARSLRRHGMPSSGRVGSSLGMDTVTVLGIRRRSFASRRWRLRGLQAPMPTFPAAACCSQRPRPSPDLRHD